MATSREEQKTFVNIKINEITLEQVTEYVNQGHLITDDGT